MKNNKIFSIILTTIWFGIFISGFKTSSDKDLMVDTGTFHEKVSGHNIYTAENIVMIQEWQKLWKDSENKFGLYQFKFARWRKNKYSSGKTFDEYYDTRIDSLEMMNKSLQTMLETYEFNFNTWRPFKRRFELYKDIIEREVTRLEVDYQYQTSEKTTNFPLS